MGVAGNVRAAPPGRGEAPSHREVQFNEWRAGRVSVRHGIIGLTFKAAVSSVKRAGNPT